MKPEDKAKQLEKIYQDHSISYTERQTLIQLLFNDAKPWQPTQRQYYIGQILANPDVSKSFDNYVAIASAATKLADEVIKQENEQG